MTDVIIVGGGPAGLSAALFTAKNGLNTVVFDTDQTWLHKAHLFNYPGIGSIDGTNYINTLREQVDDFGVDRHQDTTVTIDEEVYQFCCPSCETRFTEKYDRLQQGAD